jgi:hypothetical protein
MHAKVAIQANSRQENWRAAHQFHSRIGQLGKLSDRTCEASKYNAGEGEKQQKTKYQTGMLLRQACRHETILRRRRAEKRNLLRMYSPDQFKLGCMATNKPRINLCPHSDTDFSSF